jgi:hypothetical protein
MDEDELATLGRALLSGPEEGIRGIEVLGENMENTKRKVVILRPWKSYHAYGDMLHHYAMKNLLAYMSTDKENDLSKMNRVLSGRRYQEWVNLGGQIMRKDDLDKLRSDIGNGILTSWKEIHDHYNILWNKYTIDKQKHAWAVLCGIYETEVITGSVWDSAAERAILIQRFVSDQVYSSRKKDYDNPYRKATFRNDEEMKAAIGVVDENSFIVQVRKETEEFEKTVAEMRGRK